MLIGITGIAGAGKTFSANIIKDYYSFMNFSYDPFSVKNVSMICSFSEPIKSITMMLFPDWDKRHTRGELKEVVDPRHGVSPRRVQQIIGFELLKIKPTIWSDIMFDKLAKEGVNWENKKNLIVVDDIRTNVDFGAIKNRGGTMIGIISGDPSKSVNSEDMKHKVESEIRDIMYKCDLMFVNHYDEEHADDIKLFAKKCYEY